MIKHSLSGLEKTAANSSAYRRKRLWSQNVHAFITFNVACRVLGFFPELTLEERRLCSARLTCLQTHMTLATGVIDTANVFRAPTIP